MGKPLTEDKADDIVRQSLKFFTDDVIRRLNTLEQLVREDLNLDREQKQGSPDSNFRLDGIINSVSNMKNDINILRNEVADIKRQINEMYQEILGRLDKI